MVFASEVGDANSQSRNWVLASKSTRVSRDKAYTELLTQLYKAPSAAQGAFQKVVWDNDQSRNQVLVSKSTRVSRDKVFTGLLSQKRSAHFG